jgi:hypothetical protein
VGLVTIALAGALVILPFRFGERLSVAGMIGAMALLGLMAAVLSRRPRPPLVAAMLVGLSAMFILPAASAVLPGLDRLWLSRSAADLVAHHPPVIGAPLVAIGYAEPSLVFLIGGHVRLTPPSAAAETLVNGGAALVSNRVEAMFRQALSTHGLNAHPLGGVAGFDYSNGQHMVLTLYDVGRSE